LDTSRSDADHMTIRDVTDPADALLTGAIQLPDGAWVRGRGLRQPIPPGSDPTLGLYLGVVYTPS
jgi:hypothetical protein